MTIAMKIMGTVAVLGVAVIAACIVAEGAGYNRYAGYKLPGKLMLASMLMLLADALAFAIYQIWSA